MASRLAKRGTRLDPMASTPDGGPHGRAESSAPFQRHGLTPAGRRRWRRLRWWALPFVALVLLVGAAVASSWSAVGGRATGERLLRLQSSPAWRDGQFTNVLPRHDAPLLRTLWEFATGGSSFRSPSGPLPVLQRSKHELELAPASGLRVTWLGHSTLLVEVDGLRFLIDPVWGERSSPLSWVGPKRFFPPPLALADLPRLDAVLISHDHYDHLDYPTVQYLRTLGVPFIVPLGVGAHLAYWGVESGRIIELDWWGEHRIGPLRLVCTPARHFSGRSLTMSHQNETLWSGWAMLGPKHRVYYSGDTAMFPGFRDIGERLGPFDVTLIESGAYDARWADVHLGPEQAVLAHQLVKGKLLIPVHWGLFDLALHGWTEPVERVLLAAREHAVPIVVPVPGGSVEPAALPPSVAPERWWPEVPWKTAREEPCVSSGLEPSLLERLSSTR
jgi:L-ascorbate metabolism protein UlaG (beta-lactamase superfamily)